MDFLGFLGIFWDFKGDFQRFFPKKCTGFLKIIPVVHDHIYSYKIMFIYRKNGANKFIFI